MRPTPPPLADILDLQIYAGARTILGKTALHSDYDYSQKAVKSWSKTAAARKSVWHTASLIRTMYDGGADDRLFHYSWRLYSSTLTCWAFQFALSGSSAGRDDDCREDSMVWSVKAEMTEFFGEIWRCDPDDLGEHMLGGKFRAAGLVAVVSKYLNSVRWALVREGMKVLRGLIAGRLIEEYETMILLW